MVTGIDTKVETEVETKVATKETLHDDILQAYAVYQGAYKTMQDKQFELGQALELHKVSARKAQELYQIPKSTAQDALQAYRDKIALTALESSNEDNETHETQETQTASKKARLSDNEKLLKLLESDKINSETLIKALSMINARLSK